MPFATRQASERADEPAEGGRPTVIERTLLDIFADGIEKERDAVELYRLAAELAGEGTELGRVFAAFAAEAREHERLLVEEDRLFQRQLARGRAR